MFDYDVINLSNHKINFTFRFGFVYFNNIPSTYVYVFQEFP
jgi:hypothetical protein